MDEVEHSDRRSKCRWLRRGMFSVLSALCAYIFVIQAFSGDRLADMGERQQSRLTYLPARRGDILARGGEVLNSTCAQYDVAIRLDRIRDPRDTLSVTLNKAEAAVADLGVFLGGEYYANRPSRKELTKHIRQNAPLPFIAWTNADADTIARFSAEHHRFPYAELTMSWRRQYFHGNLGAHVRGYVASSRNVPRPDDWPKGVVMDLQDMVGKTGMEAWENQRLRGQSGFRKIQTDVLSFQSGTIETRRPQNGQTLRLTLDLELQRLAESLLRGTGHPGAMVLLDLKNGDVLAMASYPAHYLPPMKDDSQLPGGYTNRATRGYYPPGSTLKPLIALAALERGVFKPGETFHCPGYYLLPDGTRISCSSKRGHGKVDVVRALAVSCNVFFCEAAVRLKREGFMWMESQEKYSGILGRKTGIFGGKGESAGVFYGPRWVENHRFSDVSWSVGDGALAGIGQGAWVVTPLQMAVYAGAITAGRIVRPRISLDGPAPASTSVSWPSSVWFPVLQGLVDCIHSPAGTGRRAVLAGGVSAYGKTGTAEHVGGREPHAWMFMTAPAQAPRFAVACVVEEGGHGGSVAGPLVKAMMNRAFQWERTQARTIADRKP